LAEQTSAAAASLTEKAQQMEKMIQFFKVNGGSQRGQRTAARAAESSLEFVASKPLNTRTEGRTASAGRQAVAQLSEGDEWEDF